MNFDNRCWEQPWIADEDFKKACGRIAGRTLLSLERLWVLWQVVGQTKHLGAEIWECGVYKGGSALLICRRIKDTHSTLRLFDTFTGIPFIDTEKDNFCKFGDFGDAGDSLLPFMLYDKIDIRAGIIPYTFVGLEASKIAFCHVDVDVYQSVKACCEFVWPRLIVGGAMVFDDYNTRECEGARIATDEFFSDKKEKPIMTWGESAVVFKSIG